MNIGVTTFGGDGGRSGIGRYITQLLRALAPLETDAQWQVAAHANEAAVFVPEASNWKLSTVSGRWHSPVANVAWHQLCLPSWCRSGKQDVLFLPAGNRRLPWRCPCPSVGVVHDFSALHVAAKYDPARMFYIKTVLPALIRRLTHVITVSDSSRRDLLEYAKVPDERITVTPLGADHGFFNPGDRERATASVQEQAGVAAPYLLYVSRLEHPGKNHVRLIRAFDIAKTRHNLPHRLVLAGSDWSGSEQVHAAADAARHRDSITFMGFVPGGLLPDLYRAADAVVFPSLFEGFGLPVLEAMCCATPVACSNVSSMPEVAGDAAILFNPMEEEDIARAIGRITTESALREELVARGLVRAALHTWENTAKLTWKVLSDAAKRA
jgi:glycosyltransferase involved in cell wall biosynthesis